MIVEPGQIGYSRASRSRHVGETMNRGHANVAAPTEPPIPGGKTLLVELDDGIAPGRERDR